MPDIHIGLIGLGRFAFLHARIWRQLAGVEVAALCDRDAKRFPIFQELFPRAKVYTDWQEMLVKERLDAVIVLTPEHLHAEPAIAALQSGLHVFVEKPLAADVEEAEAMIRAASENSKILMAGHVLRFDPRYAEVKRQIRQGGVGAIRSIYAKRNNANKYFSLYSRIDPVFVLGIHDIDLMHWYTEDRVREVTAVRSSASGGAADLSWAMLRFEREAVGILENHWLLPEGTPNVVDVRMEITGDAGIVTVVDPEIGVTFANQTKTEIPALIGGHDVHGTIGGALANELEHFVHCIKHNQPSAILLPEDALEAVRVAQAVKQSAELGRTVTL